MAIKVTKPPTKLAATVLAMARSAERDIRRRAFPGNGDPGKDLNEKDFSPLTERYKKRKVKKGHHGVPDQRFTSGTANALGVTRETPNEAAIGWKERGAIAEGLDRRNKFWGLSAREHERVLAIANRAGKDIAAGIKITGSIVVQKK